MAEAHSTTDTSSIDTPYGRMSLYRIEEIPLYTPTGIMMMHGRSPQRDENGRIVQHIIVGAILVERKIREPWFHATRDNPYAWHWIQKMRKHIGKARDALNPALDEMEDRIDDLGFTLDTFPRPEPEGSATVKLKTGIGDMAVDLVRDADLFESAMRFLREAHRMKDKEVQQRATNMRSKVRSAFRPVMGYWSIEVTADDIANGTPEAKEAEKKMGKLPEAIFEIEDAEAAWSGPIVI